MSGDRHGGHSAVGGHFNGLKTAALFGAIWALLLAIGALVAGGRFIWVFALLGVATTFYGYWNRDRKSTRLNSSHSGESRMPSSA